MGIQQLIKISLQTFPKSIGNFYHNYVEVSFWPFLLLEPGRKDTSASSSSAFLPFDFFSVLLMCYMYSVQLGLR